MRMPFGDIKRRGKLVAIWLALCLLTGCMGNLAEEHQYTGQTLPPAQPVPSAPIGDSQSTRDAEVVLYMPDADAARLTTVVRTIQVQSGQTKQEACVAALLKEISESPFYTGAFPLQLELVSNPVETSGDLVTVNLGGAAGSLGRREMFALRVAITNTLTEMGGIRFVQVLVSGRDTGLNLMGTLPTGALARYPSGSISSYWGQIETEQVSMDLELQKFVPLYFVTQDGTAMLAEVRNVTFPEIFSDGGPDAYPERNAAEYARVLLEEMAKGALQLAGMRRLVPSDAYFDRYPVYKEGERVLQIYFHPTVDDHLTVLGATRGMLFSSICYTLAGFIAGLDGITIYVGDTLVTEMELMDGSQWAAQDGLMKRDQFTSLTADTCTVYYPLADGAGLSAVTRPIEQRFRTQPRVLLCELMKPPPSPQLTAALPEGITDADILGVQIKGDTALLNLSAAFASACADMTDTRERDMVYAIVNTLTEIEGVMRVLFYINGEQRQLAGHLYMTGSFMRHTGLIRQ
ncbi:MAG: GerMN domain-containing protein [Firmicutes bacterium]|nr:GerMN domain-containing protein [Bacillota bacterium]